MQLLRFVLYYVRANFQVALEYRASFWARVFGMFLNDVMWIAFWGIFFSRFRVVRGYGFPEIVTLWSFAAFSFGIATGVFGGCWRFARQIANGEVDFYLVLPKPVLLHLLVSTMMVMAWGDVLFGIAVFLLFVHPSAIQIGGFLLLSVPSVAIFVAYAVIANSLSFWLGNSDGLTQQALGALLIFATYPSALFGGVTRVVLYSVIPAGLVAYLPVTLLRHWSWPLVAALYGAATLALVVATGVFYTGLRRYESGNLMAMRA